MKFKSLLSITAMVTGLALSFGLSADDHQKGHSGQDMKSKSQIMKQKAKDHGEGHAYSEEHMKAKSEVRKHKAKAHKKEGEHGHAGDHKQSKGDIMKQKGKGNKLGHSGEHKHDKSHKMKHKNKAHHVGDMGANTREVMGQGRINKVMAERGMVNIKHQPMPEMNWPKMSMNFKAQEQIDLSNLKPGQEVDFTLLVDDDNNYVIKGILIK